MNKTITTDWMDKQEEMLSSAQFQVRVWSEKERPRSDIEGEFAAARLEAKLQILAQLMDGAPVEILIDDCLKGARGLVTGDWGSQ